MSVGSPEWLCLGVCLIWVIDSAQARDIRIESLSEIVTPNTVGVLDGLWCRNVDKVIRLQIGVDWPAKEAEQETSGYQRLIFWDQTTEFLFPSGSYSFQHGYWIIDGYFIARSGGTHQGVNSEYFERIDDTKVLLNPDVREVQTRNSGCK